MSNGQKGLQSEVEHGKMYAQVNISANWPTKNCINHTESISQTVFVVVRACVRGEGTQHSTDFPI